MNKENTNRMFYIISAIIFGGICFFFGGIYKFEEHQFEKNRLIDSIDVQLGVINRYENNADYHALFNYKSKKVTANCNKCEPLLTEIQTELDSINAYKGALVVSQVGRNPSDRNVTASGKK